MITIKNDYKEPLHIITFKIEDNATTTPCPFGERSNVGSATCRICPNYLKMDINDRIVICVNAKCPICAGYGILEASDEVHCSSCNGTGK